MKNEPPIFYKWLMICICVPVGVILLLLTAILTINTHTNYICEKLDNLFEFLKIDQV